jgi:hypothetical protein
MYNFFDMAVLQSRYNDGYAYCNMYVDPKWVTKAGAHDDDIRLEIYEDCLKHLAGLKSKGYLFDVGVLEFARWFRANRQVGKPEVSLWQAMIFGSGKQAFWYIDGYMRALVDPNQGGAITDLRPYAGRLERDVGADSGILFDGSYPYILHTQYRGGWPCFMSTRSMFTAALSYKGKTVFVHEVRTKCRHLKDGDRHIVEMDPVELSFDDVSVSLATKVIFEGSGLIRIQRKILSISDKPVPDKGAEMELLDFLNGTCGTTEYPTDLRNVKLVCCGMEGDLELDFTYSGKQLEQKNSSCVYALVPDLETRISLYAKAADTADAADVTGIICDGLVTGPMYTLGIRRTIKAGEVSETCLAITKM